MVRELGAEIGKTVNPRVTNAFITPPASMGEVADRYGQMFADVERQWRELLAQNAAAKALPDANAEAVRQVLYGPQSPCVVPDEAIVGIEWYFDIANTEALWKLQGEVDRWLIQSPQAPATQWRWSIVR